MTPRDRAATALAGLLADTRHRPPRVVARQAVDLLASLGLLADDPDDTTGDAGQLVTITRRTDPPSWLAFVDRLPAGIDPVAVTRNRTRTALEALGLDPDKVRAVVIEHDFLRVFRWSDRTDVAQTMPILKDKESAR